MFRKSTTLLIITLDCHQSVSKETEELVAQIKDLCQYNQGLDHPATTVKTPQS